MVRQGATQYQTCRGSTQVVVSLTFRKLSKMILRKYTMPEITFMALATRTKFQLEIFIRSTISAIYKFQESILESSQNVGETTPRSQLDSRAWQSQGT